MNEQDQIKKESNTLDVNKDVVKENANTDTRYRFKAAAFLSVIGAFGFLTGFGGALAAVKKQDPSSFDQGLTPTNSIHKGHQDKRHRNKVRRGWGSDFHQSSVHLHESGAALASRALAHGTLWAVFGCGVLFFSIWKLTGAKDLNDFRMKAGSVLPKISKNEPPVGRTDFSGINDFLSYLIEEDKKKRKPIGKQD